MDQLTQVLFSRDGTRATLTLNRPESLNALSPTLISEAIRVVEHVAASDARVLVVTGAGRSFSAGVDLKIVSSPDYTAQTKKEFSTQARALGKLLETIPQPTIARITGYCFTGGLELALGCDLLIASDDAIFCDTHAKLGLRPSWGLSQRLPRLIGAMRAREMSFTARRVGASEAAALGLILEALPLAELDARIDSLVEAMVANSAGSLTAYKNLYRAASTHTLDDGLDYEATTTFAINDRNTRLANRPAGK